MNSTNIEFVNDPWIDSIGNRAAINNRINMIRYTSMNPSIPPAQMFNCFKTGICDKIKHASNNLQ